MTRSPEKHSQICQQQAYKADKTHLNSTSPRGRRAYLDIMLLMAEIQETTKDDDYPIIYRVLPIPNGAGFQPSTVELPFDGC